MIFLVERRVQGTFNSTLDVSNDISTWHVASVPALDPPVIEPRLRPFAGVIWSPAVAVSIYMCIMCVERALIHRDIDAPGKAMREIIFALEFEKLHNL